MYLLTHPSLRDTVCEDQPASTRQFDFARNAHRAHSGFTLRGKEKVETGAAHSFLPRFPKWASKKLHVDYS